MADEPASSVGVPGQTGGGGTADAEVAALRMKALKKSAMLGADLLAIVERLQAEKQVMEEKAASDNSDEMINTEELDCKIDAAVNATMAWLTCNLKFVAEADEAETYAQLVKKLVDVEVSNPGILRVV